MHCTPAAPCWWCRCRKCRGVEERSHASDLQMAISGELGGDAHVFSGMMAGAPTLTAALSMCAHTVMGITRGVTCKRGGGGEQGKGKLGTQIPHPVTVYSSVVVTWMTGHCPCVSLLLCCVVYPYIYIYIYR